MKVMENDIVAGLLPVIPLVTAGVVGIGYTSAITMPPILAGSTALMLLWDLVVVQLLGAGLAAVVLSYMSMRYFGKYWLRVACITFLVTQVYLFGRYGLPLSYGLGLAIHVLVMAASVFLGAGLAHLSVRAKRVAVQQEQRSTV